MIRGKTFFGVVPGLVLALALLATFGSWYLLHTAIEERTALRFRQQVSNTVGAIVDRLKAYDVIMRGAAGLFLASESVGREEFQHYYSALHLNETHPGIRTLGYARHVPPDQKEAYQARIRREGLPNFTIHPEGPSDDYMIVTYLEPLNDADRGALGFNGLADKNGKDAIERARDTGQAAISGELPLRRDPETQENQGVLMFVPVYEGGHDPGTLAGRRAALQGVVYGTFRVSELMHGILSDGPQAVGFALYDGDTASPARLLYNGRPTDMPRSARTATRTIQFGGRDWTLSFVALPSFDTPTSSAPMIAALAGTALSLILYLITVLLTHVQTERRMAAEKLLDAEKQLRQAQKMEAIGQLTGGIAHDFNNLLQVILGNTEILTDELDSSPRLQRLANITQKAAERGAELTSRLLAFARRQALNPAPTDVNRLLFNMEPLLTRALGEHIEIRITRAAGLRPALVDAGQLENAILNLCINARDAMSEGGQLSIETAEVKVTAGKDDSLQDLEPGPYVTIVIADKGKGMDVNTLGQAFEPFFTTKEVGKGSGLGLSMVFGFAKQSHGHVKLESQMGKGTTASLYLPVAEEVEEGALASGTGSEAAGQGERILLVEDNEAVLTYVSEQLQGLGYQVTCAATGGEALTIMEKEKPFDLLFTDLVMPGQISGKQLAEQARAKWPQLQVLFTTGYSDDAAMGTDGDFPLLNKPYRRAEMAAKVRQALEARRTRR